MNQKQTVLLCFGGRSAEHEVSLNSARNIYEALDKKSFDAILCGISKSGSWYLLQPEQLKTAKSLIDSELANHLPTVSLINEKGQAHLLNLKTSEKTKVDVAFPVMHGTYGEDGSIQGLFRMMNLAFVGCGVLGSAIGMDKEIMKRLLTFAKIPNARFTLLTPYQNISYEQLVNQLGTPFFIKPANMGSSVGVHKIKNQSDFDAKLKDAFHYDEKVIAEEFIEGREIECSVMGPNHAAQASAPGEVTPNHEFYSYEAKYLDDNGAGLQIPAQLSPEVEAQVKKMAVLTYQTLECSGMTRVDFFLKKNGELLVNEINTIPGFTKISMYPKMWEASGIGYSQLISQLLNLALSRHESLSKLSTNYF